MQNLFIPIRNSFSEPRILTHPHYEQLKNLSDDERKEYIDQYMF